MTDPLGAFPTDITNAFAAACTLLDAVERALSHSDLLAGPRDDGTRRARKLLDGRFEMFEACGLIVVRGGPASSEEH